MDTVHIVNASRYAKILLPNNQCHFEALCIYRMGQIGQLSVDNRPSVQGSSPGQATQLNFYSNSVLYLGKH